MTKNCCKYFTVSLVPVASLVLAVLFALGIVALPIIYVHLAQDYRVSGGHFRGSVIPVYVSESSKVVQDAPLYVLCEGGA